MVFSQTSSNVKCVLALFIFKKRGSEINEKIEGVDLMNIHSAFILLHIFKRLNSGVMGPPSCRVGTRFLLNSIMISSEVNITIEIPSAIDHITRMNFIHIVRLFQQTAVFCDHLTLTIKILVSIEANRIL